MESNSEVSVELEGPADADFSPRPDLGARGGELAVQALFRTAGLTPGGSGTLTYNGDPVSTILGVDLPVTGAPDVDVRALVSIDNIDEGQTVSSPVTVTVSGNTFEANVNWLLLDANGANLHNGYAMVGSYGEWAQADIELGALAAGTYTFKAFEQSAKDGSEINVDDKTFTVE
ncbi:MAG: Gmad2 immunoglobulin-like domain-containing protein [Nocardioidaceae bacterium]